MLWLGSIFTTRASISDILTLCDGTLSKIMGLKGFILVYFTSVKFVYFKHTIFAKRTLVRLYFFT